MNPAIVRWRLLLSGKVQHVGFRYTAYYIAKKLSLNGWVQNCADGRVLVEVQGPSALVRKFLLQLKSQPHIHIAETELTVLPPLPGEHGFSVRP